MKITLTHTEATQIILAHPMFDLFGSDTEIEIVGIAHEVETSIGEQSPITEKPTKQKRTRRTKQQIEEEKQPVIETQEQLDLLVAEVDAELQVEHAVNTPDSHPTPPTLFETSTVSDEGINVEVFENTPEPVKAPPQLFDDEYLAELKARDAQMALYDEVLAEEEEANLITPDTTVMDVYDQSIPYAEREAFAKANGLGLPLF